MFSAADVSLPAVDTRTGGLAVVTLGADPSITLRGDINATRGDERGKR